MPSEEEYLDQLLKGITEPVKQDAVIEAPESEEPVIEVPEIEELVIEDPIIEEPIYEEPVMQEPVFDVPVLEEQEIEIPVLEEPVSEESFGETAIDNFESDDGIKFDDEDILKKMVLENATIEDVLGDDIFVEDLDDNPDEDDNIMSVEEIEQILAANQSGSLVEDTVADNSFSDEILKQDQDLMSLLEESSENELQDIYDMLRKSDNNEAIDEDMMALLGSISDTDEASRLQAELDGMEENADPENPAQTEREKKAAEKKRLKAEKAEAKRASKEAKKAEKEAKRAAKKASKETAKENKEAVDGFVEAKETDVFEGIDDLSTADMLDLQELLAIGNMETPSDDAIAALQQDAKVQTRPKMVDVPESSMATGAQNVDESMSADMLEIDELLSLAGISGVSEDDVAVVNLAEDSSGIEYLDESEIQEKIPEKAKKGLFARILDFLTETDEDDEEEKGTEDIPLSDENRNILEEMDKEEKSSGKKKGKKDKKSKKGKKGQVELETLEDDEDAAAPKEKKAKKAKKPKKEKEQHLKVMPMEDSKSKIPVKAMISIGAVCVSILAVVLLLVNLGGDFALKRQAQKAYYNEDYETCYQTLYGKDLNESEQVMFAKSESILRIRLRMRQYEMFVEEKSEVEALDVLIQTVYDYAELYEYASKWNAGEEVAAVYAQMLGVLQDKYHLTESDALEIAAEPNDVEYTKIVTAVAEGKQYSSSNEEAAKPENLPDMLPEELQFPENNGGQ